MPGDDFRPIREYWSIGAWILAGTGIAAWTLLVPVPAAGWVVLACLLVAARDIPGAWLRHKRRRRLQGRPVRVLTHHELVARVRSRVVDATYVGDGFGWGTREAQLAFDLKRLSTDRLAPIGVAHGKGLPWIHGLGGVEAPVWFPVDAARGHTLVVGTTGAGKTRLLELLVTQAILRGDAVIVFDPKGDAGLADTMRRACLAAGGGDRFRFWHKAFPDQAFPLDPLAHARDAGELASRIAGLARRDDAVDVFTGFAQRSIRSILEVLRLVGERATLRAVLKHLERGPEALLQEVISARMTAVLGPDWVADLPALPGRNAAAPSGPLNRGRDLLAAWRLTQRNHPALVAPEIEALAALADHDRTHAQKLLAGMLPILHQLTSGPLGAMLDPEAPVRSGAPNATDFDSLIGERAVVYLGLDSLSDPMVGAALGRLLLADLASLAGDLHHRPGPRVPIACYIDEAAECLAEPAVALLNKGRSAGFAMTVLTQTVADFVAATGSEARARQVLGNTNNVFCLRVRDVTTRDYVSGLMPDAMLQSVSQGVGTGATPASLFGHSLQDNAHCQAQALPLVDPMLLGALPDLECFAQFAGGAIHKIAIPLLAFDPAPRCGR